MIQEKLTAIENAYIVHKEKDIYIFNEDSKLPEVKKHLEAIKNIQFELTDDLGFNFAFEVMHDACNVIGIATEENPMETDLKEQLENADFYELSNDVASVYTATRLSYLTIHNQDEITDIVKEFECDIQTACAVWYDRVVAGACEKLREWVLE